MSRPVSSRKPAHGSANTPHQKQQQQQQQLSILTSTSSAGGPPRSPLDGLGDALLEDAQRDYPRLVSALLDFDELVHYHEARYDAKDAELTRCIHVGEELIDQLDQLKDRCRVLAQERDTLISALAEAESRDRQQSQLTAQESERQSRSDQHVAAAHAMRQRDAEAFQRTLEKAKAEHADALRRQEVWWQARLDEAKQERRDADKELQHRQALTAQEMEPLRRQAQEAAHAAQVATRNEETARLAFQKQQEESAALRRQVDELTARCTRLAEAHARDDASVAQQLTTLQNATQRLRDDPDAHVPVTSALLTLTSTGQVVQHQLQQLLEHAADAVQDAQETSGLSSDPEVRKVLAKAASIAAKALAPPRNTLRIIGDESNNNSNLIVSDTRARQGVYHAWLDESLQYMLSVIDALANVWRVQEDQTERVRRVLMEKCGRDVRQAQTERDDLSRKLQDAEAYASTLKAANGKLEEELARSDAEHRRTVDALTAAKASDEDTLRATLSTAHVQEKQRLCQVADAQMQSVVLEAQLEVERLQRANARLQSQIAALSRGPTQAPLPPPSSPSPSPSPAAPGALSSSTTLSETVKCQAAEITRLEAERSALQRRVREEEAARQALKDELGLALAKSTPAAATSASSKQHGALVLVKAAHDETDLNDDASTSPVRRLEQENRNLRARLVLAVREAQDELDNLQAQNVCLTQDLAKARAELETMQREVVPELEAAAQEWQTHRQNAQGELQRVQAALDAKRESVHALEAQLAERDAALAAAQRVRQELEAMGNDLKDALGRAAMDVQQQSAREDALQSEKQQLAQQLAQLTAAAQDAEKQSKAHASHSAHVQGDVERLKQQLEKAERATATQQQRLNELEQLAKVSAKLTEDAQSQRLITEHTLEAAQARADAAESALVDAQAELQRQRRLTERARQDARHLAETSTNATVAHEQAKKAWEQQIEQCRGEIEAAHAAQRESDVACQTLQTLCDQLRGHAEYSQATAQAAVEDQLRATLDEHRAAMRLREEQLDALRVRLETSENGLERALRRLEEREATLADAHAQLAMGQQVTEQLETRLAEMERALKAAQRAEASARDETERVRREWAASTSSTVPKEDHETLAMRLRTAQSQVTELTAQLTRVAPHERRAETLQSELTATLRRLEKAEAQREALQQEVQALRQRSLDAQSQHAQAVKQLRERLEETDETVAALRETHSARDAQHVATQDAAQQARIAAEAKVAELQQALASREGEAQVALDRLAQDYRERLAQVQREADAIAEASRRELETRDAQCVEHARRVETLTLSCQQYAQELESREAEVERLQRRVQASRAEVDIAAASHTAERKELEALRRVNRALEGRLADVEGDREPLRQRLRHLLDSSMVSGSVNASASSILLDGDGGT